MSLHCHACLVELKPGRIPPACPACGAIFGRHPDWAPVERGSRPPAVHGARSAVQPGQDRPMPKQKSYPWALCAGRFLTRLFFGTLLWIGLMVLWFLTGIPYGGGSTTMAFLVQCCTYVAPLWVIDAFLPPRGTWDRMDSQQSLRKYGILAVFAIYVAGVVCVYSLYHWNQRQKVERNALDELAISLCKKESTTIAAQVSVDSLLIDSGMVDGTLLSELLGTRAMRFVELRPRKFQRSPDHEKAYGVTAYTRVDSHFIVEPDVKIVRLSLGDQHDPGCTSQDILGLRRELDYAPFVPGACLLVELDQQSRASHVVKAIPMASQPVLTKWAVLEKATGKLVARLTGASHVVKAIPMASQPVLTKWAVLEQATGIEVAGLTSLEVAGSPLPRGEGRLADEEVANRAKVNCNAPHATLMKRLHAPAGTQRQWTFRHRFVTLETEPISADSLDAAPPLNAVEEAAPAWRGDTSVHQGPAWDGAYEAAKLSGWSAYAEGVIDFNAKEILTPQPYAMLSPSAHIRGSEKGFMVAQGAGINSTALSLFGLDGQLVWKRRIVPSKTTAADDEQFSLKAMAWGKGRVRLYGTKSNSRQDAEIARIVNVDAVRLQKAN